MYVIMPSETWLDKAVCVYVKGYDVRKEGMKRQVVINNKLKYSRKNGLFDDDGKIEACAIELYIAQDKIIIVSCYRQPHMTMELWYGKNSLTNSGVNS